MDKWIRDGLSNCLDCTINDEMLKAILSISNDAEFDDYFQNLLNEECEDHRLFLVNCRRKLLGSQKSINANKGDKREKQQTTQQQKPKHEATNMVPSKKNKPKFVSLYANDGKLLGDTILLKGRRVCDCQATQHKLVNNCLECGRIVCEQEGSGPCLFCNEPVYTQEEELLRKKTQPLPKSKGKKQKQQKQDITVQQSKKNNFTQKLSDGDESLKKALEQRDRLIEYDRNSEKRTTVIDDELDYFQENSVWLSDAERDKFERLKQEMHNLKHASRAHRKIKIDFAGRAIDDDLPISEAYEQKILKEITATNTKAGRSSSSNAPTEQNGHSQQGIDPNLDAVQPIYAPTAEYKAQSATLSKMNDGLERIYNRVQDKELLEMQDMRQCLSMHQPWASLLIAGIKKHEGRVWYSELRGRLWIASTAKEPQKEDIEEMENFYRKFYKDEKLKFPENYPTGRLLGCVNVEQCLPQEEYREIYPEGESESPYVFVCTHPEQLPVMLPIQGGHKIYEIPIKTHSAACKTLLRARNVKN